MPGEEKQSWRPKYNPWLITSVVAVAAFMEILDSSIANVALPHIAGGLAASQNQSTWVLTTYLVTNAIVLPISGWLTGLIGRKRFFMICIALFTASSIGCAIAPNLGFLLLARALQGAGGGGLAPMAQAIMADSFPPNLRGMAFSVFGITAVVGPAAGPTLGGWITDSYSWRWVFWINVPVGLILLPLVFRLVEDPPFVTRFSLKKVPFDYLGFSALALGIGAFQVVLDKGQEDDWFSSNFITSFVLVSVIGLSFLILWEWFARQPLIDVKMFKNANFSGSCLIMFFTGVVSFAGIVLMPQFLQTYAGYTAEKAGLVLTAGAIVLLISMPIIGVLTTKIPVKYLIAFGWVLSVVGLYVSAKLFSSGISFKTASVVMFFQDLPLGFLFIPTTTASYTGFSSDKSDAVSGLVNFMRQMGSSVGTAMVNTVVAQRGQFHLTRLSSHTGTGDLNFQNRLNDVVTSFQSQSAGVGSTDAQQKGLQQLYNTMYREAATMAYIDVFVILGYIAVVMFFVSLFMKKNDPGEAEQQAG